MMTPMFAGGRREAGNSESGCHESGVIKSEEIRTSVALFQRDYRLLIAERILERGETLHAAPSEKR